MSADAAVLDCADGAPAEVHRQQPDEDRPVEMAFNSAPYDLLFQGAEARVWAGTFLGMPTVVKQRFAKRYRHPSLDARLTSARLRGEVRALLRARRLGVPVPAVYNVDLDTGCIYMERVAGAPLRALLQAGALAAEAEAAHARALGALAARLHDGGLVHGDLTTSNVLVRDADGALVAIDFGLAYNSALAEDRAVDLYVLERAFASAHHARGAALFEAALAAYAAASAAGRATLARFAEVRLRGRKRTMVG